MPLGRHQCSGQALDDHEIGRLAGECAAACSGLDVSRDCETVLIPPRDGLSAHAKIRLYNEIGPDFRGIEPAAMREDFTVGCCQTKFVGARFAPAALPISGSSHRFLEQTQGETRRPGTLSIQPPA